MASQSAGRGGGRGRAEPGERGSDDPERRFRLGLARALGGAVIFALPVLMTMEMWHLGFYMARWRLALLLVVSMPMLVGLSRISGFEETRTLVDDTVDAFVAVAVGFAGSAVVLLLLWQIGPHVAPRDMLGKVAVQAVPASIGALLAQSQLGGTDAHRTDRSEGGNSYWDELLLMAAGALFLAFNVAPTEEMVLIAYQMPDWLLVVLVLVSIGTMHAFVYAVGFRGQEEIEQGRSVWSAFARLTIVGYAIALLISAYILWTFGRMDHVPLTLAVAMAVVLAFPASIGAAAARLIL